MNDNDDDDAVVQQVAREYIEQYGPRALLILRERADMADEIADALSGEAWRDIADAAERILRDQSH